VVAVRKGCDLKQARGASSLVRAGRRVPHRSQSRPHPYIDHRSHPLKVAEQTGTETSANPRQSESSRSRWAAGVGPGRARRVQRVARCNRPEVSGISAMPAATGFRSMYAQTARSDSSSRIATLLKRPSKNAPRALSSAGDSSSPRTRRRPLRRFGQALRSDFQSRLYDRSPPPPAETLGGHSATHSGTSATEALI